MLGRTRVIFIFAVLVGSAAYGDTFTFRDGRIIRGRVLAEFRDHLYVALGAESGSFVKRSELASVVAENGEPLGDSTKPSPALAVSSPAGDVRVEHAGATTAVTELDFAGPKDRIVTGDTGLARLALLTGGVAKLGPSSSVVARPSADRADVLELERGQVFLTPAEGRGVNVVLSGDLRVELTGGSVELVRDGARVAVSAHDGRAQIESPTFRVAIPSSHGVALTSTGEGLLVAAERSNASTIELIAGRDTHVLQPGESFSIASGSLTTRTGGSWRLTSMKGTVRLRQSGTSRFVAIESRDADQVRADVGDSVATDAAAEAVFTRDDGATVSLREASELAFDELLAVTAGAVKLEVLREPVRLEVPAGEARLAVATLEVRRPARGATALEIAALEGDARITLSGATGVIPKGARARLDGRAGDATIQATEGTVRVATAAQPETGDPDVQVALEAPHGLGVRAEHAEGVSLLLEGDRTVTVGPEKTSARIDVAGGLPRVVFATGVEWALESQVTLRFGSLEGTPVARFPNSARVRFPDGNTKGVIGAPAIFTLEDGTRVTCKDGIQIALRGGEGLAGAIVGTRLEDRFEIPRRNAAVASRRGNDLTHVKLGDGRTVAIEDGAPPVQERLTAASGPTGIDAGPKPDLDGSPGLTLTMPGAAPLSLPGSRRVTVLATRQGEFVILDDPSLLDAAAERDGLHLTSSQGTGNGFTLDPTPNHLPELLTQPPPASPVK